MPETPVPEPKCVRACPPLARSTCCLVLPLFFALSGCERAVVTRDYFPMHDGNRWEYRLLDEPMLKALAAGGSVETATSLASESVLASDEATEPKAEVVGEHPLKVTGADPQAAPPLRSRRVALLLKDSVDDVTYRAAFDGFEQVWSKRGGYVGFQNARGRHYLLLLPPHTGSRWIVTDQQGQNQYFEIEKQADLATPAGLFKQCVVSRQESRDRREVFRYWFAPEIGLVRRSKYYLEEEVFRQELVARDIRASMPAERMAEDREIRTALKGGKRGSEHRKSSNRFLTPPDGP